MSLLFFLINENMTPLDVFLGLLSEANMPACTKVFINCDV